LLQTEEYTRALLRASRVPQEKVERVVEIRKERQSLLDRSERPELFMMLGESVLRQAVGGPDVMKAQLQHLMALAERPGVSIRVLPFELGAHEALNGPFVHLEFPDATDPDVIFLEHSRGTSTFDDDSAQTAEYQVKFFALEDIAPEASRFPLYADRAMHALSGGEPLAE
jgi:hypothetical protein